MLSLEAAAATSRPDVGGKAANLARLIQAGLPVPSGFCVTTAAFEKFLTACPQREQCRAVLAGIEAARQVDFAAISRVVVGLLEATRVPSAIEEAVLDAWREQGADRSYAVRSSATVEDSVNLSFAGLFESRLNVRGRDALLAAIKECWLSLFSPRVLAYQVRHDLSAPMSAMAVVVQEMIPAELAGVLFTTDPTTGAADRVVIEAAPGLGESVVGGRVAPDRIILAKSSLAILARTVGGHTAEKEMALDDSTARTLARLSRRVEESLRGPLDIEWAMSGGDIFLLQARPATGRGRVRTWEDRQIWSNANSGEAVPDPLTPMTHSVLMPFLQGLIDNLMGHLGFSVRAGELLSPIAGRPYFNVNLVAALLRYAPGIKPTDVGDIFGGAHEPLIRDGVIRLETEDLPRLRFRPLQVFRGLPPVLVAMMRFLLTKHPQAVRARLRFPGPSPVPVVQSCPDDTLLNAIHAALPNERTGRHPAMRFMGIGAFWLVAFFALCKRWFGGEGRAMAARLTAGLSTLDPAEAGRDFWRLAGFVREHPQVRGALAEEHSFAALECRLAGLEGGRAFLERWQAALARHGHHTRGEVELMNPRWCETPDVVLGFVRQYLEAMDRNHTMPATRLAELAEQRSKLERECFHRLVNPGQRLLFRFALDWARRGVAIKENVKSDVIRSLCHARRLLLELGRRLVERGRCQDGDAVFFLRMEELRPDVLFGPGTSLEEITSGRRAEYRRNLELTPPPVVFGTGDPGTWRPETNSPDVERLEGLAVSPGVAVGRARVILKPHSHDRVLPGEILVAPSTDPAWSPYFLTAAGIAIDLGGVLSHGSILAREYGLPAVTNLGSATRSVRTGDLIQVDGNRGRLTILERGSTAGAG